MRDPSSTFQSLDTPLLTQHRIVYVERLTPPRPVSFYVALDDAEHATMLSGSEELFERLVTLDEVHIDSPDDALSLARLFLTVSSTLNRRQIITTAAELPLRPGPDVDQDAITERLAPVIVPPVVEETAEGYHITAFLIEDMALMRISWVVTSSGRMVRKNTFLEELPLTYTH